MALKLCLKKCFRVVFHVNSLLHKPFVFTFNIPWPPLSFNVATDHFTVLLVFMENFCQNFIHFFVRQRDKTFRRDSSFAVLVVN